MFGPFPPSMVNGQFPSGSFAGFVDGTFALPGAFFASQPALGFYRVSAGVIGCTGLFQIPDGTPGAPGVAFTNDPDVGIFRQGANSMGFASGGNQVVLVQATTMLGGDGTTGCFLVQKAPGTATAPAFSFVGDTGNGVYRPAANQLGFATNSAVRVIITNTAVQIQTGVALRLGNTYVAVAPGAATGTVTLQDLAGTTYRVPVLV